MGSADSVARFREQMTERDDSDWTTVDGGEMALAPRGGSNTSLACGVTSSPAQLWGWEPGETVRVTVEEGPDGRRRVRIEETDTDE